MKYEDMKAILTDISTSLDKIKSLREFDKLSYSRFFDAWYIEQLSDEAQKKELLDLHKQITKDIARRAAALSDVLTSSIDALKTEVSTPPADANELERRAQKFLALKKTCNDTLDNKLMEEVLPLLSESIAKAPEAKGPNIDALVPWKMIYDLKKLRYDIPYRVDKTSETCAIKLMDWKQAVIKLSLNQEHKESLPALFNELVGNISSTLDEISEEDINKWPSLKPFLPSAIVAQYPGIESEDRKKELKTITAFYDDLRAEIEAVQAGEAVPEGLDTAVVLLDKLKGYENAYLRFETEFRHYQDNVSGVIKEARDALGPFQSSQFGPWRILLDKLGLAANILNRSPLYQEEMAKLSADLDKVTTLEGLRRHQLQMPRNLDPNESWVWHEGSEYLFACKRAPFVLELRKKLEAIDSSLKDSTHLENAARQYFAEKSELDKDYLQNEFRMQFIRKFMNLSAGNEAFRPLVAEFYADGCFWQMIHTDIKLCTTEDALKQMVARLTTLKQEIEKTPLSPKKGRDALNEFNRLVSAFCGQKEDQGIVVDHPNLYMEIATRVKALEDLKPYVQQLPQECQALVHVLDQQYLRDQISIGRFSDELQGMVEQAKIQNSANLKQLYLVISGLEQPVSFKHRMVARMESINKASSLQVLSDIIDHKDKILDTDYSVTKQFRALVEFKQAELITELKKVLDNVGDNLDAYLSLLPELDLALGDVALCESRTQVSKRLSAKTNVYGDDFFWKDLQTQMAQCASSDEIQQLVNKILPMAEDFSKLGELENPKLIRAYHVTLSQLKKLIKDKFQDLPPLLLQAIMLPKRDEALQQISDLTAQLSEQEPQTEAQDLADTIDTLGSRYCFADYTLEKYRREVLSRLQLDKLAPPLAERLELRPLLRTLRCEVWALSKPAVFQQELRAKLAAINDTDNLSELDKLIHSIPDTIDSKDLADWRLAMQDLAKEKLDSFKANVQQEMRDLLAKMREASPDWNLCAKSYLNLLPQCKILNLDSESLGEALLQAVQNGCAFGEGINLDHLQKLVLADNENTRRIEYSIKEAHTAEELNVCAFQFFELKASLLQGIEGGGEGAAFEVPLKLMVNNIAKLLHDKIASRALPVEAAHEDLIAFCDKAQAPEIEFPARKTVLDGLKGFISAIDIKKQELVNRNEQDAVEAAELLLKKMVLVGKAYVTGEFTLQDYKTEMKAVIKDAHAVLDNHRGWKQLLLNLALAIFTLGIGYLALAAYQGCLFPALPVATASSELLTDLDAGVDTLAPSL